MDIGEAGETSERKARKYIGWTLKKGRRGRKNEAIDGDTNREVCAHLESSRCVCNVCVIILKSLQEAHT